MGAAEQPGPERFESASAGFSIAPPAGWHAATAEEVAANRQRIRLSDEELQEAMRQHATAPLFAFMKHPKTYADLNPTIQVVMRPIEPFEGKPPTEILTALVVPIRAMASDFTLVQAVREAEVSGLKAAGFEAKYTLASASGEKFPVLARLWVVPRGKFLFIIGMSGAQEGSDVCAADFGAALASIRIEP